jgi:hypothetical protein
MRIRGTARMTTVAVLTTAVMATLQLSPAAAVNPQEVRTDGTLRMVLDGGMFIPVGQVLSTSDPDTAMMKMNLTWSFSDTAAISYIDPYVTACNLDETCLSQGPNVSATAKQASFKLYADGGYPGVAGVSIGDQSGNSVGWDYEPNTTYAEAQTLTKSAGWTVANCNCWMNHNTLKSNTVGAWVSIRMGGNETCDPGGTIGSVGDSVGLIGDYASGRGTANVLIDGTKVATVSEAKSTTTNRVVVWQKRYKNYTTGSHTIRFVVASGRFDIDGIQREFGWNWQSCGG